VVHPLQVRRFINNPKEGESLMQIRLSLPVERNAKLAPKHQQHGTPVGALLPASTTRSLGVDDLVATLIRGAKNAR
jgi:hypothetical protein